jgi:hypothetical protein
LRPIRDDRTCLYQLIHDLASNGQRAIKKGSQKVRLSLIISLGSILV